MPQMHEAVMKAYLKLGLDTEKVVYSMLLSQTAKLKDIKELNLMEIIKTIHEADIVGVNFEEGELTIGARDCYEVHSISGCRDDDGDPQIFINLYDTEDNETNSVRLHEFPHLGDLHKIIRAVDEKCSIKFSED